MKVTVKDTAVRYNGTRYERDEELTIAKEHFNEEYFVEVEEEKKSKKTK